VIRALADGLDVALAPALGGAPAQPGASGVGAQTRIEGFRRRQGTPVPLYPDVFVYPHPSDPLRATYTLAMDGPPVLIVEVLSPSTAAGDLDEAAGKVWSYGAAGVREYLVFDPVGDQLATRVRAWRWAARGRPRRWRPEADGRWHSAVLAVSLAVEGFFLRVYDGAGQRILPPREVPAALAAREAQIAAHEAQIAALRAELEQGRGGRQSER
jgi:hypothetical protein